MKGVIHIAQFFKRDSFKYFAYFPVRIPLVIRNNPANPVFRNQLSRSIPDDGYDLLMQLLQFNPMKRISASVGVGGKRDMK